MGNEHLKAQSTSLGIQKMQIKTMRCSLYTSSSHKIRGQKVCVNKDGEQQNLLQTAGEIINWYNHFEEQSGKV